VSWSIDLVVALAEENLHTSKISVEIGFFCDGIGGVGQTCAQFDTARLVVVGDEVDHIQVRSVVGGKQTELILTDDFLLSQAEHTYSSDGDGVRD